MSDLRKKQNEEARRRMKALKMIGAVTRSAGTKKYYSERQSALFDGILYEAEGEVLEAMERLEAKTGCLAYHAQLSHTEFGRLLSILFVGKDESEWADDMDSIENGESFAYVANLDGDGMSEYGYVGIAPKNGGITRTW